MGKKMELAAAMHGAMVMFWLGIIAGFVLACGVFLGGIRLLAFLATRSNRVRVWVLEESEKYEARARLLQKKLTPTRRRKDAAPHTRTP